MAFMAFFQSLNMFPSTFSFISSTAWNIIDLFVRMGRGGDPSNARYRPTFTAFLLQDMLQYTMAPFPQNKSSGFVSFEHPGCDFDA
jgi:hypothetical protein